LSRRKSVDMSGRSKCPVEKNVHSRVGAMFVKKILEAKAYCKDKDQNYTILCSGVTGGGKSTLMLHKNRIVGDIDFERMAFDIPTSATSYQAAKQRQKELYDLFLNLFLSKGLSDSKAAKHAKKLSAGVVWDIDELKVYSSKHASSFNTDLLDLLLSVRFKNFLCWANAPSPRVIDRKFLEEKIFDAFIYVHRAQARYLWFSYDGFMKMNKEHGGYSAPIIESFGEYYAEFDGYFNAVPDSLFSEYEQYKFRAVEGVEDRFIEKYADGQVYSLNKLGAKIDADPRTIKKYVQEMQDKGLLPESIKTPTGIWQISEKFVPDIKEYLVRFSKWGSMS